jgi:CRISPR-associated protein Csb2
LPLVTDTLPLAEAMRRALLGRCADVLRRRGIEPEKSALSERCPAVVGKDSLGRPLREGHSHALVLPADEDRDGRIDHVTLFASRGFSDDDVLALDRLRQLRWGDGDPLRLMLLGLGTERDFARSPLFATSAVWLSATPFVVTRYPKLRGTKRDRPEVYAAPRAFVRHVLRQELERRPGLPPIVSIQDQEFVSAHQLRPIQFKRFRNKPGDDGGRRPAGAFRIVFENPVQVPRSGRPVLTVGRGAFRIVFENPVQGPLCLGHSCHFGLGLFLPERRGTDQQ